jgi:hypothetical protein
MPVLDPQVIRLAIAPYGGAQAFFRFPEPNEAVVLLRLRLEHQR